MSRTWLAGAAIAVLLGTAAPLAQASMQVRVDGAVVRPGVLTLRDGARLSDAALAVPLRPSAYVAGAAWLRPGQLVAQERLKAGVLFDLHSLQQWATTHDKPELRARAARLATWLAGLPVTGRTPALLDPRVVEVNPAQNLPLAPGDRLYYPRRPATIELVGAVRQPCTLPLVPLQDARRYLAGCTPDAVADPDDIYVIEPDGRVFRQGYALWNRGKPLALAPGAVIFVPLRASSIAPVNPGLNHDLAAFLATQILPGPGSH